MGIFGKLFGNSGAETANTNASPANTVAPTATPSTGILNLNKGDILDLSKHAPNLTNVRAAAGWDVVEIGHNMDLDLCAYMMSRGSVKDTIYYGNKHFSGIYLDGDNLTGAGDGDDENIFVNLDQIPCDVDTINFAVVIYGADSRHQSFTRVRNAYMRLVDETTKQEICRYRLSEDGGNNTAALLASLSRDGSDWKFTAIGNYSKDSIQSLSRRL